MNATEESGRCGNSLIQQGNVKRVRVGPSAHGLGLFVAHGEEIRKDDFIIGACSAQRLEVESAPR
jgi:hypothetical protein